MCDTLTLTITPTASADGVALFAKNSDREPNEAHEIVLQPAMDHAAAPPATPAKVVLLTALTAALAHNGV